MKGCSDRVETLTCLPAIWSFSQAAWLREARLDELCSQFATILRYFDSFE